MKRLMASTMALVFSATMAFAEGPVAYFIHLHDGSQVSEEFLVQFGLKGFGVAPAGVEKEGTGHHHLLVDRVAWGEGPEDKDMMESGIYADDNHIHFGKGQTEVMLKLPKGKHSLQLLLGDANHLPLKDGASERITVIVE